MRIRTASALVIALALLGACGDGDDSPGPSEAASEAASEEASPSPSASAKPAGAIAPLTGERVEDLEPRPVLAVKVENTADARPQSGLEDADIVFEELVEGGITRFIAIFNSRTPDVVGPIRSGRFVDADVLPAFDAVLFMSGAAEPIRARIAERGVPVFDEDGNVLFRDSSRSAPHNVYGSGEAMYEVAADMTDDAQDVGWTFAERAPRGAVACPAPCADPPGEAMTVAMSGVSVTGWEYERSSGLYRRSQDGAPQVVTGAGKVGAANVIVLGMQVGPGICCDPAGNPLVETTVTGSGRAIFLRDGERYEGEWTKAGPEEQFTFSLEGGRPYGLKPGPTWVLLASAPSLPAASD